MHLRRRAATGRAPRRLERDFTGDVADVSTVSFVVSSLSSASLSVLVDGVVAVPAGRRLVCARELSSIKPIQFRRRTKESNMVKNRYRFSSAACCLRLSLSFFFDSLFSSARFNRARSRATLAALTAGPAPPAGVRPSNNARPTIISSIQSPIHSLVSNYCISNAVYALMTTIKLLPRAVSKKSMNGERSFFSSAPNNEISKYVIDPTRNSYGNSRNTNNHRSYQCPLLHVLRVAFQQ
jgi:hypothetical protein